MKPKVLILTDWYVPGYRAGGPIQSLKNMVEQTQSEVDYTIFTGDRDLQEEKVYAGVEIDAFMQIENHRRLYTSVANRKKLLQELLQNEGFDIIYLNSFFSLEFTIKPLLQLRSLGMLHKVVLAPRGMLGRGALSIKPLKKRLFLSVFRLLGIDSKISIHSTDPSETVDIQMVIPNAKRIVEISNIPAKTEAKPKQRVSSPVSMLFASRVSPKKNLLFGLEILSKAQANTQLSIYGVVDDEAYGRLCKSFRANNIEIDFNGAVDPTELSKVYDRHNFFILPTQNENFGHAIIEALSHGLPVIISDQCPWTDLEEYGAGWVTPLSDENRWIEVVNMASSLKDSEYNNMSALAIQYVQHKINFDDIRNKYLTLFRG